MEKTINECLVMRKSLIQRRNDLKELVEGSSRSKMYGLGEDKVREEAAFNIQDADRKKTEIDLALYDLDAAIKQVNANTKVPLPAGLDFRALMLPIEAK